MNGNTRFGLIIAAGVIDNYAAHRGILSGLPGPGRVYCADGGLRHASRLGIKPDLILGDFDSAAPDLLAEYRAAGVPFAVYPAEKDFTDTELAAERAAADGFDKILVIGAYGARIDHTFANIQTMYKFASRGVRMALADNYGAAAVLPAGVRMGLDIRRPIHSLLGLGDCGASGPDAGAADSTGKKLSVLPIGGPVRGATAEGLKYRLDGADLEPFYTTGVSNEFTGKTASIRLEEGAALVMICND